MSDDHDEILALLTKVWGQNPNWRLGQLVHNATAHAVDGLIGGEIWFLDDKHMLTGLRKLDKEQPDRDQEV